MTLFFYRFVHPLSDVNVTNRVKKLCQKLSMAFPSVAVLCVLSVWIRARLWVSGR